MAATNDREPDARDRILQAASELFYRDGILTSGVDRLIALANVAKATFYRHFPSKNDLVLAWLQGQDARWIDLVVPELEGRAETPLQRLVGFWDVLGDWLEQHDFQGCPFLNPVVEIRDPDASARREVDSYVGEVEDYFHRTAEAAGSTDPAEVARQLRDIAMGLFMAIRVERSRAPIERARSSAIGLLALSLGTTPREVERRVARSERKPDGGTGGRRAAQRTR
jgi:AcrR family transcriptional regulator